MLRSVTLLVCATLTVAGLVEPAARMDDLRPVNAQLQTRAVKELAAGKLLVAARGLPDPNFTETVILLAEHSHQSAMGLVLNRRTDVSIARLFPNLKPAQGQTSQVFLGGPVSRDGVLALLRTKTPSAESRRVLDDVYLIATAEGLEAQIASGADPRRVRVYVGYSGWGPGQLERETAQGAWHVFTTDTAVVFDADPDSLWQRQVRRTEERMARLRLQASARPHQLPASARQALALP